MSAVPPDLPAIHVAVAAREQDVRHAAQLLSKAGRIAFDLESNGLFAYRPRVCAVQLGALGEITLVDTLATTLAPLADVLGANGPIKVIHDVAFDARMLAEAGISLGNCHDTSLAARMLGKTATGLATLLKELLGVTVDKAMQSHDWGERPWNARALEYLASDVRHLEALDDTLWGLVETAGIALEVLEETQYRLDGAIASARAPDPRPPYARIKHVERVPTKDLAVLRRVAELREQVAMRLDVAPYKVQSSEVLFAIAQAKPRTMDELRRVRGATQGPRAAGMAKDMLRAVEAGLADGEIPEEERIFLERPRLAPAIAKARRTREARLVAWRRETAKARGVDEQVVLPGHCVKDLAESDARDIDELGRVPGLGAFRIARDGEALLRALEPKPEVVRG